MSEPKSVLEMANEMCDADEDLRVPRGSRQDASLETLLIADAIYALAAEVRSLRDAIGDAGTEIANAVESALPLTSSGNVAVEECGERS